MNFLEGIIRDKQITFGDFLEKLKGIQEDGYSNCPVFFDCGSAPSNFDCFLGSCYICVVLKHTRLPDYPNHTVDALLVKGSDMAAACLKIPSDTPLFADTDGRYITGIQWQDEGDHWEILTATDGIKIPESSLVSAV